MITIFNFKDYKLFLKAIEAERASVQRGFRSRLSEVLNCQNAYISQIFNTHSHFSLEQGFKITEYLKLSDSETKFFLLLIERARAGTKELAQHFSKDIEAMREKHFNVKERVSEAKTLTLEDRATYYSSSLYASIHIITTIPEFRTTESIATALKIPLNETKEMILFLLSCGLLEEKKGQLIPGGTQIHLPKDTAHVRQHHTNWRLTTIGHLSSKKDGNVHYSTVSSLSLEDAKKLKNKFVEVIVEYIETVGPSKEETLYNFNLDFYELLK
jgi:Uncharacterized protein conserved in archaea (DUF2250).